MAKLIDVDVSRQMNVSPEAVWSMLADLNRLPEWLVFASSVEDVSGPAQPGATYTVKPQRSYEPTTHWAIAEAEPPARQLHTSEMPVVSGVRSELKLTPSGDGVAVRVRWTGTPKAIIGKMMSGDDAEADHGELGALARSAREAGREHAGAGGWPGRLAMFFAVRLERGGPYDFSRDLREQDGFEEHARFMDSLVDEGFIVLGGPVAGERETLHAVDAPSEQAIRERLAEDNWVRNGMLRIKSIEPWEILLDGRAQASP